MCEPQKADVTVAVLANEKVATGFYRMRIDCPNASERFRPGQFFQLHISPGSQSPLLRRPFAPSWVEGNALDFVYAVVGKGTRLMTELVPGDKVGLLYPLGNGFDFPHTANTHCVLVGGGCGAPSMLYLAKMLKAAGHRTDIVLGAKNACSILESEAMMHVASHLYICTDDGSAGIQGTVIAGLEQALTDTQKPMIFACGPEPMLRAIAAFAMKRDIRCQVSLEARMACGFGACVGCVTAVREGEEMVYKKVCKDGPVFEASSLVWK